MTRGGWGVNQMMTNDGDGIEKKVKDKKNHQLCTIQGKKILKPN